MKAQVFDPKGKKVGQKALPKEIFGAEPNLNLIAQAVRVNLLNKRQGTRKTKGRSDLHYSGRKLWRQKGTGRARHGDRTANIFRKGAKAHGPKLKSFSGKMPRKMARRALISVLSILAGEGKVMIIKKLEFRPPHLTKKAADLFKKMKITKVSIVCGDENKNTRLAVRNLPKVQIFRGSIVSTYNLAGSRLLLFTEKGLKEVEDRLLPRSTKTN